MDRAEMSSTGKSEPSGTLYWQQDAKPACRTGRERTDAVCVNVLDTLMDKKKMVKKEESA